MLYRILADCVVLVHAAFVAFVVLGGFLAWRWRWVVVAHVPCALWGIAIEYRGWICPLTPLENALRARAGLPDRHGCARRHDVRQALQTPRVAGGEQQSLFAPDHADQDGVMQARKRA